MFHKFLSVRVGFVLFFGLWILACGKYGNPLPPEKLNPRPVVIDSVEGMTGGIKITWFAPEIDERGLQLKNLDGYYVYRRDISSLNELDDFSQEFIEHDIVSDYSNEILRQKRESARVSGKPLRLIDLSNEEKLVTYIDQDVKVGHTYVYRIVPFNQSGFEGRFRKMIKVAFNGVQSEVLMLSNEAVIAELEQPDAATIDENPFGEEEDLQGNVLQ